MLNEVKDYYGKELQGSEDLKTNACCTDDGLPRYIKDALINVNDEVLAKYYGCGLIAPEVLEGARILDLGCGTGRDCYVLSQLVGESGEVVGVDMTDEQLAVAEQYVDYHADQYGYAKPNTRFLKGYIEKLDELDLETGSFDVIVSNCVINLSTDKQAVLDQAWNLLKPGGEMYFSDVYSDRRVTEALRNDPVIYGECLGGALYWNDFLRLSKKAGFSDPRLVEDRPLTIDNKRIEALVKPIKFYSATYRLMKLEGLEPFCENYGQAVKYKGSIPHNESVFVLDKHHQFETGRVFPVCGNTWAMLHDTRFKEHFEFIEGPGKHLGIFDGCGEAVPFDDATASTASAAPCC